MNRDELSYGELMDLEARLRVAEGVPDTASVDRVLRRVQTYANRRPAVGAAPWGRRLSMFAAVGIPVAAAAGVAGIFLLNAHPQKAIVPVPAATPSARPTSTPVQAPEALLAITQRRNPAAANENAGGPQLGFLPDTVELTKRDGTVIATATFKAGHRPSWTNAATIMPPQAHVVGGAVYYIDGDGVVRRLDRAGNVSIVATFSTSQAQHMSSFAVSPDGSKVMASMYTWGPSTGQGLPGPFTTGPSYNDLLLAEAGGSTKVLSHTPLASTTGHFMVVDWDAQGPLAGTAILIAAQNPPPEGWNSPLYHLDLSGNFLDRVGGSSCIAVARSRAGSILCAATAFSSPLDVRTMDGTQVWAPTTSKWAVLSAAISPSGDRVSFGPAHGYAPGGPYPPKNSILRRGAAGLLIPTDFYSVDFLDEDLIIGYSGNAQKLDLATISIAGGNVSATKVFPVPGFYVGSVPAS